jgi:signal transduction histidine kinase
MKPTNTLLLFLFFAITTHAQKPSKLDSLKNVLAHLPAEGKSFAGDTLRVRVLCEMGEHIKFFDTKNMILAKTHFQKGINLSEKRGWEKGLIKNKILFANCLSWEGRFFEAARILTNSASLAEKEKLYNFQGKALRYLGDCYYELESYDKALESYFKALPLCNKYEKRQFNITLNNIGNAFFKKKSYQNAIQYYRKSLSESEKNNDKILQLYTISNLAVIYREKGTADSSLAYFDTYFKLNTPIIDEDDYFLNLIEKSKTLLLKKDYESVERLLKLASLFKKHSNTPNVIQFYETSARLHELKGESSLALENYKLYDKAKELNEKDMRVKQVESIRFEFENKENKTKISLLNSDLKNETLRRNIILIIAIFSIIAVLFAYYANRVLKKQNLLIENQKVEISELNKDLEEKVNQRTKKLQEANEELKNKNQEILNALTEGKSIERKRVAIELHDNLGSSISAIKWQLEALEPTDLSLKKYKIYLNILKMLTNVYGDIRLLSHNMLPEVLENEGLKSALEKLVRDLNSLGKIKIDLDLDDSIKFSKQIELEIYGIILELLNNTLKHANASEIQMSFLNYENSMIEVLYFDNGIGIQGITNEGSGLKNIKNRLSFLNGDIIFDSQKKNQVKINFPVFYSEDVLSKNDV